jgi:hypothetical protein
VSELEWYKYCPICIAQGTLQNKNPENPFVLYHCNDCSFNWVSESKCKYHIQDNFEGHLCNSDTTIGECRGDKCPRLTKIHFQYQGFSEKTEINYILDDPKIPQDLSEE